MIDLFLSAGNAGAFAAACPWLRGPGPDGGTHWITDGDGFAFDPIGALVIEPAERDEDGQETRAAVLAEGWHGNLRCTPEVAARVPGHLHVEPHPARRRFAGDLAAIDMPALRAQAHAAAMAYGNAITDGELGQWAGIEPFSWAQQRAEALLVRDGEPLDETAILPALAAAKGVSVPDFAASVLVNAARYSAILVAAASLRRAAAGLLDEAIDTPQALAAAVAALKAETDTVAAQLIGG